MMMVSHLDVSTKLLTLNVAQEFREKRAMKVLDVLSDR